MRYGIFLAAVAVVLLAAIVVQTGNRPAAAPATQGSEVMNTKKAIFAAGCFWGVETSFRHVPGVVATKVGYTGGTLKDPSYQDVCTDETGHAEAVEVTYDPAKVSFEELLDAFWSCHDPTTKNFQGPDYGTQYRSGIFYLDEEQQKAALASIKEVDESKVFKKKIVTEVTKASTFYAAEEYHQQYFAKKGREESCHMGVVKVKTKLAEAAAAKRSATTSTAPASP